MSEPDQIARQLARIADALEALAGLKPRAETPAVAEVMLEPQPSAPEAVAEVVLEPTPADVSIAELHTLALKLVQAGRAEAIVSALDTLGAARVPDLDAAGRLQLAQALGKAIGNGVTS